MSRSLSGTLVLAWDFYLLALVSPLPPLVPANIIQATDNWDNAWSDDGDAASQGAESPNQDVKDSSRNRKSLEEERQVTEVSLGCTLAPQSFYLLPINQSKVDYSYRCKLMVCRSLVLYRHRMQMTRSMMTLKLGVGATMMVRLTSSPKMHCQLHNPARRKSFHYSATLPHLQGK